jgi:hypothetical protein
MDGLKTPERSPRRFNTSIGSWEFLSAAAKALRSPMGNRQVMSLGVSGFSALGQRCLYALSAQQHVVISPASAAGRLMSLMSRPRESRQDENAERYRRSADVDRRDHSITRCSDDRYGMVKLVRDIGLAAVRSGLTATPTGCLPTATVADTVLVAVSMTDTVPLGTTRAADRSRSRLAL